MSLYISNASNAVVKDFSVVQPQFWAVFVDVCVVFVPLFFFLPTQFQRSSNITLDGVYVNATNMDPAEPVADPQPGSTGS